MAIYLTQGGNDETRVNEIEDKLRSAIPGLKRVSRVEDIDQKSVNGADRSIVLLVAAALEGAKVDDLIDVVGRQSRNLFFIVVGGDISGRDYKRLIQSGNADWVAEGALPQEILDIVPWWFRSRRAREVWAIRPSLSKPPSTWSKPSQTRSTRAPRSHLSILISSQATCAIISTSRPSFSLKRSSPPRTVSMTTC
jgi:hypothetical protein